MRHAICLLLLAILQIPVYPCTTFLINKNGQYIFGRNYDWVTGAGMVHTNLRGLFKTSMKTNDGETISWVSKYGSITFNQYGKEFPTGGMNEKGLVVELMWLDETTYPGVDNRPSIGVLQWIQYQLDNCASIDELIATDQKLRITSKGGAPLHYLVADASGNAATIEFLNGKMVVSKGKDLNIPVLTNSIYKESASYYHNQKTENPETAFAFGNNSLQRFGQACEMIQKYKSAEIKAEPSTYAFSILDKVSQGEHTKWSIVYDITNRSIQFRTNRFRDIKKVSFSSFELSCKATAKCWDMNQKASGDVTNFFLLLIVMQ